MIMYKRTFLSLYHRAKIMTIWKLTWTIIWRPPREKFSLFTKVNMTRWAPLTLRRFKFARDRVKEADIPMLLPLEHLTKEEKFFIPLFSRFCPIGHGFRCAFHLLQTRVSLLLFSKTTLGWRLRSSGRYYQRREMINNIQNLLGG